MTNSDARFCQEPKQLDGITQSFKSQQACVTALAPGNALNVERMLVHLLRWSSTRTRRVCISTLKAEACALSNAVQHGWRTRAAIVDMRGPLNGRRQLLQQWDTPGFQTATVLLAHLIFSTPNKSATNVWHRFVCFETTHLGQP